MAKEGLGAKRICPETGKKFYDLNKDPVVSPYTGKSYPRAFFEEAVTAKPRKEAEVREKAPPVAPEVVEEPTPDAPEFVSLEEVEVEEEAADPEAVEIPDLPEVEVEEDEAAEETFLAPEEDEDENLSDVIGGADKEET